MNEMDSLLTTRQLQDLLQVDRITIYRMLNDGRLQGFKVGGQWRFSRQAIQDWLQEQRASLGVVEPPRAAADLRPSPDSLPLTCIQAIQGIFAEALGLGTITTAVDGTPLTTLSNSCEFCNLVYNTDAGRQRCVNSWRVAAEQPGPVLTVPKGAGGGRPEGTAPRVATCHAGLHYVWGRIEVQGEFVAATYAGQYLRKPPQDGGWTERIAELSAATGVDSQELREALDSVPVLDEKRLEKVPRLLQRVTATFSEIGEERLNLLGRLQRIAEITGLGN
jgi:excisionase family DNA binding protein